MVDDNNELGICSDHNHNTIRIIYLTFLTVYSLLEILNLNVSSHLNFLFMYKGQRQVYLCG